jgi:hypothetical protein
MNERSILPVEYGDAIGQALVYAQQVAAGAKLAASLQVKAGLVPEVVSVCAREGVCVKTRILDGWGYIWIYKYPYVRLLIKEIEQRGAPKSALDIWTNGKLFGYSDYEIGKALEEGGHIASALT